MGQMPLYRLSEKLIPELQQRLEAKSLEVLCVEPLHVQDDGITMYREWEIRQENGMKVIMWDKHRIPRNSEEDNVEITVVSPNGRKGLDLLRKVEQTLIALGAHRLA